MIWLRYRAVTISIILILMLLSVSQAHKIRFSYDFEDFFPTGDPELEVFEEFKQNFGPDDNFLMIGIHDDHSAFSKKLLEKTDHLTKKFKSYPNVVKAHSVTNFINPLVTPLGIISKPAIRFKDSIRLKRDVKKIAQDERLINRLVSEDLKTHIIFLRLREVMSQEEAVSLMDSVEYELDAVGLAGAPTMGRPNFRRDLVKLQQEEFARNTLISTFLIFLMSFLIFRKWKGVLVSLISVIIGMALFIGFLVITNFTLDAMSLLFPILMVIVGVSDVVHFLTKYADETGKGTNKMSAMRITIREIGLATFLTSFSTAIGFASLYTSRIQPVRNFGILSAVGVFIAFLTVLFLTTSVLSIFKSSEINRKTSKNNLWSRILLTINRLTIQRPRSIVLITIVVLAIALLGLSKLNTNTTVAFGLPHGQKLANDFEFFESNFRGYRPFELLVRAKDDNKVTDWKVVQEIDKLEQYIRTIEFVNGIESLTMFFKSANRATHADRLAYYKLPESKKEFDRFYNILKKFPQVGTENLISGDEKKARITGGMDDIGSKYIDEEIQKMYAWTNSNIDTSLIEIRQTGMGVLLDKNNQYLRQSLLVGLGLAFLVISIMMALLFKNWRMVLISLIPNLFPLIITGAIMGFSGIELSAPTSIIFAIAFGIAVDDTIHFLSKFKIERDKGISIDQAIETTLLETGKPIIITSIILFFGFGTLLLSAHPQVHHIGLFISITLFTAVIADLFLIPVAIRSLLKRTTND